MLVPYDVGALDGGQDPHLVESVLLLFLGQVVHFDLLEGVDLAVGVSLHLVHTRVRALS